MNRIMLPHLHYFKSAPSSSKTEITLPFFMFVYWLWALVNFSSISENESMFRIGSFEAEKLPFLFDLLSSFTPTLKKNLAFLQRIQQRNNEFRFTHFKATI